MIERQNEKHVILFKNRFIFYSFSKNAHELTIKSGLIATVLSNKRSDASHPCWHTESKRTEPGVGNVELHCNKRLSKPKGSSTWNQHPWLYPRSEFQTLWWCRSKCCRVNPSAVNCINTTPELKEWLIWVSLLINYTSSIIKPNQN